MAVSRVSLPDKSFAVGDRVIMRPKWRRHWTQGTVTATQGLKVRVLYQAYQWLFGGIAREQWRHTNHVEKERHLILEKS